MSYSFAYAISQNITDLHLYGIDFTHKAVNFAEAGRAVVSFWLAIAISKGIKVKYRTIHLLLGHECTK